MKNNQKIAVIHTVSSLWKSSGVTDAVVYAANGAANAGYDVSVITWDIGESVENNVFSPSVKVIKMSFKKNFIHRLFIFSKFLIHLIHSLKIMNLDILIHDHGLWRESNIATGWVSKRENISLLISPHGMLEPWSMSHRSIKKKIAWNLYQRRLLEIAQGIHVTAPSEYTSVATLIPDSFIYEISLGTTPTQRVSSCNTKRALFLSRVHKKKGLDILIDAWAKVMPIGWELLIVGPDDAGYSHEIEQRIFHKSVDKYIKIIGPLYGKDKEEVFEQSTLFILPSYSENFGLVIAEAFMAGLPVITTNTTPWLGLEKKGVGWTISPNFKELVNALKKATSISADKRFVMGQTGRQWMLNEFTWKAYGKNMAKTYKDIIISTH